MENMTSKELKIMARDKGVKNWWKLTKAELIEALKELEPEEIEEIEEIEVAEELEPKTKKPNLKIKELAFNGKTQSIRAWADELEMPWPTLYDRVNRNGWTVEEALTIPLGGRRNRA